MKETFRRSALFQPGEDVTLAILIAYKAFDLRAVQAFCLWFRHQTRSHRRGRFHVRAAKLAVAVHNLHHGVSTFPSELTSGKTDTMCRALNGDPYC